MTSSTDLQAPAGTERGRLPDFFIVGHAKSGTTALYEMLRRHPQVFMPDRKEPWFFARENPQPQEGDERSVAFTGRHTETLQDYEALFAPAEEGQLAGEASTSYLWSPLAAERIAQAVPNARAIAIFREPAAFLRSLHLQLVQNHHELEPSFEKALALDGPRREGREIPSTAYWPGSLIYSDRVRYVEQLRRFHEALGREQVLVLIYEDFRADNEGTVRQVLRFLDLDDMAAIEALEANPTVGVRSVRLDSAMRAIKAGRGPLGGAAKTTIKGLTSPGVRRALVYPLRRRLVYGQPPPPDERFMRELRVSMLDEVRALGEYLDRDLVTLWGYDRI